MSYSVTFIGKSENIAEALKEKSNELQGPSKVEFDAALPHLVGLLEQNFNSSGNPVLKLVASGHGHDNYRQCSVELTYLGGTLV